MYNIPVGGGWPTFDDSTHATKNPANILPMQDRGCGQWSFWHSWNAGSSEKRAASGSSKVVGAMPPDSLYTSDLWRLGGIFAQTGYEKRLLSHIQRKTAHAYAHAATLSEDCRCHSQALSMEAHLQAWKQNARWRWSTVFYAFCFWDAEWGGPWAKGFTGATHGMYLQSASFLTFIIQWFIAF